MINKILLKCICGFLIELDFGFFFSLFFKFILFIYLFLTALGLRCCTWAFSSCGERGYSLLQCTDFSLWWLFLLRSTGSWSVGFSSCGTQAQ